MHSLMSVESVLFVPIFIRRIWLHFTIYNIFRHVKHDDKLVIAETEAALQEKWLSSAQRTEILIRLEKFIKSGAGDKLKGWSVITEKTDRLSERVCDYINDSLRSKLHSRLTYF